MPSLLDNIKGTLGSTPEASNLNQTGLAQSVMQARSGKAVQPQTTPRISNLQEQSILGQVKAGEQALAQQEQLQQTAQKLEQDRQKKEFEQSVRRLNEQQLNQFEEYNKRSQELLDEYTRGGRQLDLNKDKARLEQVGFTLRFQNQQYVDNLLREGQRNRLNNEIAFNEALQQTIFADEQELFKNDLNFQRLLNANNRDFNDELANINLDFAMQMASSEAAAANQRMMWTGIGQLPGAAAQGYSTLASAPEETPQARQKRLERENADFFRGLEEQETVQDTTNRGPGEMLG